MKFDIIAKLTYDNLKNDKFVIPLLVSGIYAEIPRINSQLYEHCLSGGCHPSAQTLGSRNFIKLVSIKVAVLCYNTTF
ncbi:hypothetical protein [Wolbachia pipientis]|uniref:hypothetical protein n=1 Tax=Wolbachia pipientis TaxID=955 RepID=UPI0021756A53|nr:hypothetical protein [Wolbachia pipientis]